MNGAKVLLDQSCQREAEEVMELLSTLAPDGKTALLAFLNGVKYGQLHSQAGAGGGGAGDGVGGR